MNRSSITTYASTLLLGAVAFGWTLSGETANPQLNAADLPASLFDQCESISCADSAEFKSQWIGRTPRGDLFVLRRDDGCGQRCTRWLMEKTAATSRVLLELNGRFQLRRTNDYYPMVELRTHDSSAGTVAERYEWNGRQYARTQAQRVYEVNGVECGTRDECQAAARGALESHDTNRAQNIWQHVWGISWI